MSIKEKVKSYSFWVSLASALVLILQVIGSKLGFYVDARLASDIITSACSILVVTGIIVTPTAKSSIDTETEKPSNNDETNPIETISPENTIKENISVLADNLKEVADKILEENIKTTTESKPEPVANDICLETDSQPEQIKITCEETQCVVEENKNEVNTNIIVEENYVETEDSLSETNNLKAVLSLQKEKYADNIDEYYQILLSEIKSLRAHE